MTREEAINEINKVFTSAYANYIVTALTEGATVSDKEQIAKNDLGVDCIDRVELLKAMNTYDKFGNDSNERLVFLSTPALQDRYVPYVHYDEMVNCVKGMPAVTPQQPKAGYISIDDAMSVFDDFMRGEVDEDGMETFLKMLKDKAESEDK